MTNWLMKFDNFWMGLLLGILFPGFLFFLYWLFFHSQINFPVRFVRFLMYGHLLSNIIKLCGLGNLLIFYLGLNKKMDKFSKGVIVSILFYVALVAYVTYYHEPEIF